MKKQSIVLPPSLDFPSALELSVELSAATEQDHFIFDFGRVGNVEPSGMLLVAGEIRRLKARFPAAQVSASKFNHMTYAAHMGFFKAFGLDFGNEPGQARGGATYLPLTMLKSEALVHRATEMGKDIGDAVEDESIHLAGMLCGESSGPTFDSLSYAIRELVRNVVEHSTAPEVELCAQYWPRKKRVEVALLDHGIGLRSSLSNNPFIDASDDKRALNYALMPAVSGKVFKGARPQRRGHWTNSGFGLYLTSRICRDGGSFFIASGNAGMLLTRTEGKRYFRCAYQGTALRMVIRANEGSNLRDRLAVYRNEGFAIQNRYREIVSIDPSAASLMLSADFNVSVWDRILSTLKGRS